MLCIVFLFISCSDNTSDFENDILTGNFKELSPIENRLSVDVTSQNLTYINENTGTGLSFTIRLLSANRLELSCNQCDETEPQIVPYKIIDQDSFEIGSFFPNTATDILTFKRL